MTGITLDEDYGLLKRSRLLAAVHTAVSLLF